MPPDDLSGGGVALEPGQLPLGVLPGAQLDLLRSGGVVSGNADGLHHVQALQEEDMHMITVIQVWFVHWLKCIHWEVDLFHLPTMPAVLDIMV